MTTTKPTLLLVDDEKNSREGLARALQRQYNVLLAENGPRALEVLNANKIDIMISDVRMPGMDGLTLLQRALALTPQPLCIIMTAYGTIDLAVEAMKRGAYDFLTKPINLDRLDLLIKRALHAKNIETENVQLREQLDIAFPPVIQMTASRRWAISSAPAVWTSCPSFSIS